MADQSQTATNKQSEPARCKQGCGFFGNAATSGFCSKCWTDVQKTKSAVASAVVVPPPSPADICKQPVPSPIQVNEAPVESSNTSTATCIPTTPKSSTDAVKTLAEGKPTIAIAIETPAQSEIAPAPVAANAPAKKKKKKKTSYKNMMASMMKETTTTRDDADKAAIRKVTGGGAFSKIEKI